MRQIVALLGIAWALASLLVAYLFVQGGMADKTVHKGIGMQASLVLAGVGIAVFALMLLVQSGMLAVSRGRST